MEYMEINGQAVAVPEEVRVAALEKEPDAVAKWFAEQDAPHAAAALAKSGLKKGEVTCTGFGGAMLTGDVERAVLAKQVKDAAAAKAATPTPAPAGAETKES